jgi:hypothetical protein
VFTEKARGLGVRCVWPMIVTMLGIHILLPNKYKYLPRPHLIVAHFPPVSMHKPPSANTKQLELQYSVQVCALSHLPQNFHNLATDWSSNVYHSLIKPAGREILGILRCFLIARCLAFKVIWVVLLSRMGWSLAADLIKVMASCVRDCM